MYLNKRPLLRRGRGFSGATDDGTCVRRIEWLYLTHLRGCRSRRGSYAAHATTYGSTRHLCGTPRQLTMSQLLGEDEGKVTSVATQRRPSSTTNGIDASVLSCLPDRYQLDIEMIFTSPLAPSAQRSSQDFVYGGARAGVTLL